MDQLRSSPSQQHLNPSRSSSLPSQQDEMEQAEVSALTAQERRPHKLDLYSIPVFLLELGVLVCLGLFAHFVHFQYKHEPNLSGFYCDDYTLRHNYVESKLLRQFTEADNELVVLALLLAVPIVLIIFCELVNSMFGALKFRKISALCTCCKLHSITRRTIRFCGAYALGFFLIVISCDVIANRAGQLRPNFMLSCDSVYETCARQAASDAKLSRFVSPAISPAPLQIGLPQEQASSGLSEVLDSSRIHPASSPIGGTSWNSSSDINLTLPANDATGLNSSDPQLSPTIETSAQTDAIKPLSRAKRQANSGDRNLFVRQWIELSGMDIRRVCQFSGDDNQERKIERVAMSWPSFPAAIVTYACLFAACYLCFVGTARPFRMISSVLIVAIVLLAIVFDVQLVSEHYNHWGDILSAGALALLAVVFILFVYLNKFRDTHYYENQKLLKRRETAKQFNTSEGHYSINKALNSTGDAEMQNGDVGGSISNNDLAMRYFQIPRANYRGAPRPMSAMNQVRSS